MKPKACCTIFPNQTLTAPYSKLCTKFVFDLKYEDIPEKSLNQAKICLFDWLGCVIQGTTRKQSTPAKDYINFNASAPQASMVCQNQKASITDAAFFNGYCGHILEMDDVDRESISHPATVVIPAALSVGEYQKKSGKDVLTAIVSGYETMLRIGAAVTPGHYKIWHTTATTGMFGSAMAAGKLLCLNNQQLDWALGNAGTMAAGLWQFLQDGGMSKFLHAGKGASNGVLAAYLASRGFSGSDRILEGSQGFFAGYARQEIKPEFFENFGTYWHTGEVSIKPYPCCRHTHSAIDSANTIRELLNGSVDNIDRIDVKTYEVAKQVAGIENPQTAQEEKFSLKFCVARTLLGGLVTEQDFTNETLFDPATRSLMAKTDVVIDPQLNAMLPKHWPNEISVTTRDGKVYKAYTENPSGDPDNALDWDGIKRKFKMMSDGILTEKGQTEVFDLCKNLELQNDIAVVLNAINRNLAH
jgi:2-methylcitrate dehydratase PrpD